MLKGIHPAVIASGTHRPDTDVAEPGNGDRVSGPVSCPAEGRTAVDAEGRGDGLAQQMLPSQTRYLAFREAELTAHANHCPLRAHKGELPRVRVSRSTAARACPVNVPGRKDVSALTPRRGRQRRRRRARPSTTGPHGRPRDAGLPPDHGCRLPRLVPRRRGPPCQLLRPAGCGCPGRLRSASARTWCTVMPSALAQVVVRPPWSRCHRVDHGRAERAWRGPGATKLITDVLNARSEDDPRGSACRGIVAEGPVQR